MPEPSAAQGRRAAAYVPCPSHDLLVAVDAKGKLIGTCPNCAEEASAGVKRLNGRIRYRNLQARKGMERF